MIVILEMDVRRRGGRRFCWRPSWFSGRWGGAAGGGGGGGVTWRASWGLWSVSYYPSPGLRDFFAHVQAGGTEWRRR